MKLNRIKLIVIILILFTGCSMFSGIRKPEIISKLDSIQSLTGEINPLYIPLKPNEGSLWTNAGDDLFVDIKARKVGDIIIVDIVENTSSKLDANTKVDRTADINLEMPEFMTGIRPFSGQAGLLDKILEFKLENEYEGKGTSDRSGKVTASIASRIIEVFPNGNFFVVGKREMKVNYETQTITVSGLIRPEDISQDNRVKSTYLADAKIVYDGSGVIAEKQSPGWLTRLWDYVSPL